ncbi:MAG: modC [Proteobacteria bacterium]|nr:modC [Pseudomonadota bacterium]
MPRRRLLDRFPALDPANVNASELAAIVFEEGASVDHLIAFFADELQTAGRRIGGIVHLPNDEEPPSRDVTVVDLVAGDHWLESRASIDPVVPVMTTRRILAVIEARADLAIIPRFGAAEIVGGGHADAFGTVAAFGLPILTAVRREDVEAWLRFTGGIGTLLACRLRVVRAWWQETDDRRQKILARAAEESSNVVPLLPTFG